MEIKIQTLNRSRRSIIAALWVLAEIMVMFSSICQSEAQEEKSRFGVQGATVKFAQEMKEAGIQITREWIEWEKIEPIKGQYHWESMDEKVRAANQAGIEILGYFVQMPFWAKKEQKIPINKKFGKGLKPELSSKPAKASEFCEPKDINDFRRFAKAVAERYDGRHGHGEMKNIEILNEVTLPEFFDIKNTDYEPWLINGYEGVKEGNPHAKVLIGAFVNPLDAKEFVDRMLRDDSRYYDIVNFHVYGQDDALVTEATRYLKSRMQRYHVTKPIWLTETSAIMPYGGRQIQDDVAKVVVKRYARAFGEGVEKVFWFSFVDMPPEEDRREIQQKTTSLAWAHKTDNIFHPRQAYHTHRLMTSKLRGFVWADRISDTQYRFNFTDRKPVYILWCENGSCSLPEGITGEVKVIDCLGNEQVRYASEFILTENPIFLETK